MAGKLVATDMSPGGLLKTLPKWEDIARKDQVVIERATKNLGEALADYGRSKLAIGEYLAEVQEKLEPLRIFQAYLRAFHFKKSAAYNHITAFRNASRNLPEPVLRRAMSRNMSIVGISEDKPLGKYTNAFRRLPPPNTDDVEKIDQYLGTIEEMALKSDARSKKSEKYTRGKVKNQELLVKMGYKALKRFVDQVETTGNVRQDRARQISYIEDVVGMVLTKLGVASPKTIEPQAVPEEFQIGPGRPRKTEEEAA